MFSRTNTLNIIIKNSKLHLVVIMALLMIIPNISQAQKMEVEKPGVKEIGLEFLGATGGEVCGCLIGGAVTFGSMVLINEVSNAEVIGWEGLSYLTFGGFITGGCVGTPLGTILTGNKIYAKGSALGAYLGGIAGVTIASILTYKLLTTSSVQSGFYRNFYERGLMIPTAFLLPPILSVTGYNLFPSKQSSSTSMLLKHAPQCAITVLPHIYNNKIMPVIGLKMTTGF